MNGERILAVDDDVAACRDLGLLLTSWGYQSQTAFDGAEALKRVVDFRPDLIISDLSMPGSDGAWLLRMLRQTQPECPLMFFTGKANVEAAVWALREGAVDFIEKPLSPDRLKVAIARVFETGQSRFDTDTLRRKLKQTGNSDLVGTSSAMRKVMEWVQRISPAKAAVAITGESGTGKEMIARAIHGLSQRANKPFVAVNCASIPPTLIESELFGHERGAFTGADTRRLGVFEQAHGGTLFLDEVGEIPIELQAKLLRVLEEGKIRRLGGKSELDVDVRILSATNRDLRAEIRSQRFREDLYFRLNVFQISLPPLRDRREDLALLAQHFIDKLSKASGRNIQGLTSDALSHLKGHSWPGNIRELKNTLERAVVLCDGSWITREHLPLDFDGIRQQAPTFQLPFGLTLDEVEKEYLLKTLARNGNNKARTADLLGISEKTLYNKLHRYQGLMNQLVSGKTNAYMGLDGSQNVPK